MRSAIKLSADATLPQINPGADCSKKVPSWLKHCSAGLPSVGSHAASRVFSASAWTSQSSAAKYDTPLVATQKSLPTPSVDTVDVTVELSLNVCVELPESDTVLDAEVVAVVVGVAVVAVVDTVLVPVFDTDDEPVDSTVLVTLELIVDETVLVTVLDMVV